MTQPLGDWLTTPTTSREYHQAGEVIYSRNALGQWSSHSCISRQCWLQSYNVDYSLNKEVNVPLPQRHQIVDTVSGGGTLVEVEHQLPEMKIQQQITDVNQISWSPQNRSCQSSINRFMDFVYVNIRLIIAESQSQNQHLQCWWGKSSEARSGQVNLKTRFVGAQPVQIQYSF